jgi:hypothetical protein
LILVEAISIVLLEKLRASNALETSSWAATFSLVLGFCSCSVVSKVREENQLQAEIELQDRLVTFRLGLRRYAAARNELPQSLAEFRAQGFGHTLEDPITGKDDWKVEIGEDPKLIKAKRGIINFHSSSTAISSRGTAYNTW